jgi:hypothetical protein
MCGLARIVYLGSLVSIAAYNIPHVNSLVRVFGAALTLSKYLSNGRLP